MQVRRGETERVVEAGSHAVGIRVIKDKRTAICSTADLTPRGDRADGARRRRAGGDLGAGRVRRAAGARGPGAGQRSRTCSSTTRRSRRITTDEMRDFALRCEAGAFDYDKRVTNSDGAEMGVVAQPGGAGEQPRLRRHVHRHPRRAVDRGDVRRRRRQEAQRLLVQRRARPAPAGIAGGGRAQGRGARRARSSAPARSARPPCRWSGRRPWRTTCCGSSRSAVSGEALYRRSTFLADLEGPAGRVDPVHADATSRCCRAASARGRSTAKA